VTIAARDQMREGSPPPSPLLVLGIETSCDETAASVVEGGRIVHSSIVSSQIDLHARFGGVVPEIASRAHIEQILPVIRAALDEAGVTPQQIDGLKRRDELVYRVARARDIPVMVTFAGGYAQNVEDTVTIHCNTVVAAKEVFL